MLTMITRYRATGRTYARTVTGHLPVLLYVGGVLICSFGIWLAWHPAGFMFAGAVMVNAALKLGTVTAVEQPPAGRPQA